MVERRVRNGVRIAQLLSSELDGREDGALGRIAVVDADRNVGGTAEGERAYDVACGDETLARVFVHDEHVRIELFDGRETAGDAAADAGIPVEVGDDAGRTRLLVESGAAVKRAVDVVDAVVRER